MKCRLWSLPIIGCLFFVAPSLGGCGNGHGTSAKQRVSKISTSSVENPLKNKESAAVPASQAVRKAGRQTGVCEAAGSGWVVRFEAPRLNAANSLFVQIARGDAEWSFPYANAILHFEKRTPEGSLLFAGYSKRGDVVRVAIAGSSSESKPQSVEVAVGEPAFADFALGHCKNW